MDGRKKELGHQLPNQGKPPFQTETGIALPSPLHHFQVVGRAGGVSSPSPLGPCILTGTREPHDRPHSLPAKDDATARQVTCRKPERALDFKRSIAGVFCVHLKTWLSHLTHGWSISGTMHGSGACSPRGLSCDPRLLSTRKTWCLRRSHRISECAATPSARLV